MQGKEKNLPTKTDFAGPRKTDYRQGGCRSYKPPPPAQGLAQDFVEQPASDLREYGLTAPQLTVALTSGADASQTLLIGGEKSQDKGGKLRYLKQGENATLFLVSDSVLHDVDKSLDDFREKSIAKFSQDLAVKIEVKRQDGQNFTFTRGADKKWSVDKPGEGVFKEAIVTQLPLIIRFTGYEVAADNPTDLTRITWRRLRLPSTCMTTRTRSSQRYEQDRKPRAQPKRPLLWRKAGRPSLPCATICLIV
jgi:hypothetical protein